MEHLHHIFEGWFSLLVETIFVFAFARVGWGVGGKLVYVWNWIVWKILPNKIANKLTIN